MSAPASYVDAARRLKEALDTIQSDTDFARSGEIIYLFDTNVLVFYVDVTDDMRLMGDVDALAGNELDPDVSKAMERLTADFIFSGELPGQTRGYGYISLPHLEEALTKISSLADDFDRKRHGARGEATREHRTLEAEITGILRKKLSAQDKLGQLSRIVPAAWLEEIRNSNRFRGAVRQAFLGRSPLVRPLDKHRDLAKAVSPSAEEADAWLDLLPTRERRTHSLMRDAETLATIVRLYKQDPLSRGPNAKRRYVLITADEGIVAAVRKRRKWLRDLTIPDFVRTPRDYLPILNVTSISKALKHGTMSEPVRREFRNVFDTIKSALEWIVTKDGSALPDALSNAMLSRLQGYWGNISRYLTTLNLYHIDERAKETFAELTAFVSRAETGRAAADFVRDAVVKVRDNHMTVALHAAIIAIARSVERRGTQGNFQRRVQIKLVGSPFEELLPTGQSINDLLDEAVAEPKSVRNTFRRLRANPGSRQAQLLAACLFIAAEKWRTASQFSERAVELSRKELGAYAWQLTEARYLHALCMRFSMDSVEDYSRAHRELTNNLRVYPRVRDETRLRGLRDKVELGTLMLTAAIMQAISDQQELVDRVGIRRLELFDSARTPEIFKEGVQGLQSAYERLHELNPNELTGESRQLWDWVDSQAMINLLGAFAFERTVPGLQRKAKCVPDAGLLLERSVKWLQQWEELGGRTQVTPHVYTYVVASLSTSDLDARWSALGKAQRLLKSERLRPGVTALDDVLEFTFLREYVQRELSLLERTTRFAHLVDETVEPTASA